MSINPNLDACSVKCSEVLEIIQPLGLPPWKPDSLIGPDSVTPIPSMPSDFRVVMFSTFKMDESELMLLELFSLCTKMVFLTGHLEHVKPLLSLISIIHQWKEIPESGERNQNVFVGIISNVFQTAPPPIPVDLSLPTLYVVGDSHSLALGWQVVRVRGVPHVIRPFLNWGLTIWTFNIPDDAKLKTFWIHINSSLFIFIFHFSSFAH